MKPRFFHLGHSLLFSLVIIRYAKNLWSRFCPFCQRRHIILNTLINSTAYKYLFYAPLFCFRLSILHGTWIGRSKVTSFLAINSISQIFLCVWSTEYLIRFTDNLSKFKNCADLHNIAETLFSACSSRYLIYNSPHIHTSITVVCLCVFIRSKSLLFIFCNFYSLIGACFFKLERMSTWAVLLPRILVNI